MTRQQPAMVALILGMLGFPGLDLPSHAEQQTAEVRLLEGMGSYHFPITTDVALAQKLFDQGLVLAFGFNHAEAARSFQEAQQQDPACAMCYWGEALVLGPNINAPMDPGVVPQAHAAVEKAVERKDRATAKELALIQAVTKRYGKEAVEDRTPLDQAYAEAMRSVGKMFPDDPLIGSLLAEALMDLHPWDFWTREGTAKAWTPEIVSTLESVLAADPDQPLANHLYIHAMEASPTPEKALPSAERLTHLVPGSSHLVHMPAHIYIRIGRYHDAAAVNQQAMKVDEHYLNHAHEESLYTAAYIPHNSHFLWAAAAKIGQQHVATKAAKDTAAYVNAEMMRDPGFGGTLQHFWLLPLYTKALFGEWKAILDQPAPPSDLLYPTAIWHYVRGMAKVRHGQIEQARQELTKLKTIAQDPAVAKLTIMDLNPVVKVLNIAEAVLEGEIAAGQKNYEAAVGLLTRAAKMEEELNYTEPKDWYLPSRQILGSVLLEAGHAVEAEQAFRDDLRDHPQSGWSLWGLSESLRAQGKHEEAERVRKTFQEVWSDADVTLTAARF